MFKDRADSVTGVIQVLDLERIVVSSLPALLVRPLLALLLRRAWGICVRFSQRVKAHRWASKVDRRIW